MSILCSDLSYSERSLSKSSRPPLKRKVKGFLINASVSALSSPLPNLFSYPGKIPPQKKRSFLIRLINQLQHKHETSCQTPSLFLNSQTSKLADNKSSVTITVSTKALIPVYRLQLRSPLRSAIAASLESQFFEDTIGTTFLTLQTRHFQASQKI